MKKTPKIGEQQFLTLGASWNLKFPSIFLDFLIFFSILLGRGGLVKSRKISKNLEKSWGTSNFTRRRCRNCIFRKSSRVPAGVQLIIELLSSFLSPASRWMSKGCAATVLSPYIHAYGDHPRGGKEGCCSYNKYIGRLEEGGVPGSQGVLTWAEECTVVLLSVDSTSSTSDRSATSCNKNKNRCLGWVIHQTKFLAIQVGLYPRTFSRIRIRRYQTTIVYR